MRLNRDDRPLEGVQLQSLRNALRDAFFQRERFAEFLHIQLNKRLGDIAPDSDYLQQILSVVDKADEEGWSAELLQGACLWRPHNAVLAMFAQQFGLMPTTSITEVFESKVRPLHPDLDVIPWCNRLAALAPKICLIDFPSGNASKLGTGFLVGVSTVMTCFHVMDDVFAHRVDPTRVSLRFDYKVLEDGRTLADAVTYHLARETWCLDSSEYSPLDGQIHPDNQLPDEDHLDYILLHVEGKPGLDPIGGPANKDPRPELRGWIDLSSPPHIPAAGTELFILHHPDGQRLKMTLNTTSVHAVNSNGTRLLHTTNTARGTSGAPCFNHNWELIALHQTGDPAADRHHSAEINQSIPLAPIRERLARRGMLCYLGEGPQESQAHVSSSPAMEQATDSLPLPGTPEDVLACPPDEPAASGIEATDTNTSPSPPDTLPAPTGAPHELFSLAHVRQHLQRTQRSLADAIALLPTTQTYILPANFSKAIRLLETIAHDIKALKTALDRTPALALAVSAHIGDMHHQFHIIFDQIEYHLIPCFYRRVPGNFTQLQSALHKVERYFSREE